MHWLGSNLAALSVLGAAIAFIVSTIQQFLQRRTEAAEKQFQAYHELIRKVYAPESRNGVFYGDGQAAAIFELRHFPRYRDFTERLLKRLRDKWLKETTPLTPQLIEEIDLTLKHIQQNK